MTHYLDASVLVPILVPEPTSPDVDRFLSQHVASLVVSDFAAAEVASALSRLVRTGLLDSAEALVSLANFDSWRAGRTDECDLVPADARIAGVFVRRFELKLRTPDALHLAMCRRLALRLVTFDARLAAAAGALGIETSRP